MKLQLTGRHVEVTPAIREFVEKKFSKLEKHFDHITSIQVIIDVEKSEHKAEATVLVPGKDLFAHAKSENLYTAIDLLMDKIDAQLLKYKAKLKDHPHERFEATDESDTDDL
jgi:putative sigma-54 modulation protein